MDEAMKKVGALEGAVDEQASHGWNQLARIEEMLDQVLNVDASEAVDCRADTMYIFTAAHKDVT